MRLEFFQEPELEFGQGRFPSKYPTDRLVLLGRRVGMKRGRFSEEEIIGMLNKAES